jgi:hypothetical protein
MNPGTRDGGNHIWIWTKLRKGFSSRLVVFIAPDSLLSMGAFNDAHKENATGVWVFTSHCSGAAGISSSDLHYADFRAHNTYLSRAKQRQM